MAFQAADRDVRQDVAEVLVRYATAIDRRDWALFRTCFTRDVHADYGEIGVWDGVDAITEYMTKVHAPMGHTLHRISNESVTRSGAGATSRAYVDLVAIAPDGKRGVHAIGFYDDELVHTADGWQIARRQFTQVHLAAIGGSSR